VIDKTRVARRFNRHAGSYDEHARLQVEMAEGVMRSVLAGSPAPERVLELGCGTGRLTQRLVEAFPGAELEAIDIAGRMVEHARARVGETARVRFAVADVEEHAWEEARYDLVVSSATIQWLSFAEETLGRLARSLTAGGRMIHATFGPRTFEELFSVFAAVEGEQGLPARPHGLSLPDAGAWEALLARVGLSEIRVSSDIVRRRYASCRACLAEVRATGASYSPAGNAGVAVLAEVMRRYDDEFREGDGVVASYEVIELAAVAP
jgi:malonyl-CoA O-methyltransferase